MSGSKNFILILITLVLVSILGLSILVYNKEQQKRKLKEDLIELSKIKYGLFNVDEWKKILADIITKKIEEFNLQGANKEKMRAELTAFLTRQVGELEDRYYEEKSKSFFGFLIQNPVTAISGIFGKIKRDIPIFTEGILDFLNDPKNRKAIRGYIINKLNEYADRTFSKVDYTIHDKIISKYEFEDRDAAIKGLTAEVQDIEDANKFNKIALLALVILSGILLLFSKSISKNQYLIFTLISLLLLLTGLSLPMIEIDARISSMTFKLLGESVTFQDQVLYFKSKSILEVVSLMLTQRRFDVLIVGLLVFIFSVIFPLSKLISSIIYIYNKEKRSNGFIQFMVFKTGKWSMADVMVIAIFMAYIGFSGLITEQLKQLETITQSIDILTTNKSSLMMGFFSFTSFAILSLLISHKLQFAFKNEEPANF